MNASRYEMSGLIYRDSFLQHIVGKISFGFVHNLNPGIPSAVSSFHHNNLRKQFRSISLKALEQSMYHWSCTSFHESLQHNILAQLNCFEMLHLLNMPAM